MDSGNSGSMQSSSGGDDEFDSRSETPFAAFFNSSSGHAAASNIARISSSFPHQRQKPQTSAIPGFFDNLPPRFDAFSRPPPQTNSNDPLFNLDSMSWVTTSTTPHDCTNLPGPAQLASTSTATVPPSFDTLMSTSTGSQRLIPTNPAAPYDPTAGASVAPRGSKKRPRASRRAPTTVLTTDTSNFRQMVQEFTGIPSPPLSSPVFPRSRFDLFNKANVLRPSPGNSTLLRSFAQNLPMEDPIFNPFVANNFSTSASSSAAATTGGMILTTTSSTAAFNPLTTTSTQPTSTSTTTPTIGGGGSGGCSGGANLNLTSNYQLPSDLGSLLESNPIFTFQSLLQTSNPLSQNNFTKPRQSMPSQNQYTLHTSIGHGETTVSHGLSNIFTSPTTEEMTLRGGGSSGAIVGGDLLGWDDGSGNGSETGDQFVTSQDDHEQFDTDVGKVGW